ncbi:MAG: hypothetical protein F2806_01990 [Actinobacteria bacterium]|nr:hypothetical protein [Actinomycetota bacterium]
MARPSSRGALFVSGPGIGVTEAGSIDFYGQRWALPLAPVSVGGYLRDPALVAATLQRS